MILQFNNLFFKRFLAFTLQQLFTIAFPIKLSSKSLKNYAKQLSYLYQTLNPGFSKNPTIVKIKDIDLMNTCTNFW